jgi:hypothetical protein
MRIYVYAPDYTSRSGGVSAMHYLMYLLQRAGHQVKTNTKKYNPAYDLKPSYSPHPEGTDDMVIAPESVFLERILHLGLPILRWVLYFPGRNGGPSRYGESEVVYHWAAQYEKAALEASRQKASTEFCLPYLIKEEFDREKDIKRGDGSVYFVYKGKNMGAHPKTAVEMTMNYPATRELVIKLFKTYKTLYSYDRNTQIINEAVLCGMDVFLWNYEKHAWEAAVLPPVVFRDYGRDTEAVRELLKDFNSKKIPAPAEPVKYRINIPLEIKDYVRNLWFAVRQRLKNRFFR